MRFIELRKLVPAKREPVEGPASPEATAEDEDLEFKTQAVYVPVEEAEEDAQLEVPPEDFGAAARELFSAGNYRFGVNELAFVVVDEAGGVFIQRERFVDLLEWASRFPVIEEVAEHLRRHGVKEALSALVDATLPYKLFNAGREFSGAEDVAKFMLSSASPVWECRCVDAEPPNIMPRPATLLKSLEFLHLKGEVRFCDDGRIAVRVAGEGSCYTLQAPQP